MALGHGAVHSVLNWSCRLTASALAQLGGPGPVTLHFVRSSEQASVLATSHDLLTAEDLIKSLRVAVRLLQEQCKVMKRL